VDAAGSQPDDGVVGLHPHGVDGPVQRHHADGEPGQIEVALRVDVGHLGRLAAE
jgi:hypothetical protein